VSLARKLLGNTGEDRAAGHLKKQGYKVLERNFRTPLGEIDLIALHEGELVFVEVKTRTNDAFGAPELAVNPAKQRRMIGAALSYIKNRKLHQMPCRFDVVAISGASDKDIVLIRNAFEIDRTRL
jgi:putative endonuclease